MCYNNPTFHIDKKITKRRKFYEKSFDSCPLCGSRHEPCGLRKQPDRINLRWSGATVTSDAVRKAVAQALGEEIEETTAAETEAETAAPAENVAIEGGLQIGQAYTAAHGDSCFTEAVAVVQGDVIVAAYLDEFQFFPSDAEVVGVPNSDQDFGADYAEGYVLGSKRENADYYSELMASHAGSTVRIDDNYDAIQNFAVGKTIDQIETVAGGENAVDAVSGATLADTAGYLDAIA